MNDSSYSMVATSVNYCCRTDRGNKGQVKFFSMLLSLKKLLDNQGLRHLLTWFVLKVCLHISDEQSSWGKSVNPFTEHNVVIAADRQLLQPCT